MDNGLRNEKALNETENPVECLCDPVTCRDIQHCFAAEQCYYAVGESDYILPFFAFLSANKIFWPMPKRKACLVSIDVAFTLRVAIKF